MYDGTLTIDTHLNTKPFNTGVKDLIRGLKGLALTATGVLLGIMGIKSVKAVAVLSAEFSRLKQAAQAVGQMYGFTSQESVKLIDSLVAQGVQTDVASRAFINFAKEGLDASLLPALALGAQNLNALADSGQSSSDVMNGLLYGILQLDGTMLRNRGVVVDLNAANKAYATSMGIAVEQMSVQERRAALLTAVIEKLRGVTGLYELSQRTAAGQMSSNARIMNEFKNVIGGALQDAFFNLIKSFNDLVKALTLALKEGGRLHELWLTLAAVATLLSRAVRSIFEAIARWLGIQPAQTSAISNMEETALDASDAQDELGDSVEEAAKKAKGALAAFDQLNVLQQDTGATGPVVPDLVLDELQDVDLSKIEDPLEAIQKRADELYQRFLTFLDPLIGTGSKLREALQPLFQTLGKIWNWLWENVLVPFGKWAVSSALPALFKLIGAGALFLNEALILLTPAFLWLWENILKPFGEWLGPVIIGILEQFANNLNILADWFASNPDLFANFGHAGIDAWEALEEKWGMAGEFFGIVMDVVKNIIFDRIEGVKEILKSMVQTFLGVIVTIKGIITGDWDMMWRGMDNVLRGIIGGWKAVFKLAVNQIIDVLNGLLAAIALAVNAISGMLNNINIQVPDWVPGIGGADWSLSLPTVSAIRIPKLATGAVIPPNAPFLALLGDQRSGTNIEMPEKHIRDIIQQEMNNITANISIEFKGSLAELARQLRPEIVKENVRIGSTLIANKVTS